MTEELELVRGSENPFRDVGLPDADTKLIKADLAAEIIGVLRERRLTGAAAAKIAGVQTADISRIRNAGLSRFTIDWLVKTLSRLDCQVEVRFAVRSTAADNAAPFSLQQSEDMDLKEEKGLVTDETYSHGTPTPFTK
jgi:predicted XRE-type DNA-binding protein